jgi:hypothetical protein
VMIDSASRLRWFLMVCLVSLRKALVFPVSPKAGAVPRSGAC